jgi:hypothetical protein
MSYSIAVITPGRSDHLTRTVIDGLMQLEHAGKVSFKLSRHHPPLAQADTSHVLEGKSFIEYAKSADLIFLCWGKDTTFSDIAEAINCWHNTVFLDGSEPGKNRRYDPELQFKIIQGMYDGQGMIDQKIKARCALYFRREKPYLDSIIPLPFGIESGYVQYTPGQKKDIDIFCVFGQDE